jgi:hypothetical protein
VPPTFEEHIQLMFDLVTVAFQADLTRIVTFMIGREAATGLIVRSGCRTRIMGCRTTSTTR